MLEILHKRNTIAHPGFNRWLVPPAALSIHLCIGMAYGFSVFWLPLTKALGVTKSIPCPADMYWFEKLFTTVCDWDKPVLGWMYTLFFVFLGSGAAVFGGWLERAGPRKAGVISAMCWCGGLVISAVGVYTHQLWMMWLGSGVIGGIGLGLGYISPVSTLIKWFPDRRGMATGMAIMGFGGGAMIGSPLADQLMKRFASPTSVGVWETFLVLAAVYFVFMIIGAMSYRVPPSGWRPAGWTEPANKDSNAMITRRHVHVKKAWRTPQFRFLWGVLCLNVSAGIGVIGMASPMLQEIFSGQLIGVDLKFDQLNAEQLAKVAAIAAGFTGLLSLFNIAGRFLWASLSDFLGRKTTYFTFFTLGFLLYAAAPSAGRSGSVALFAGIFCIILTMYGGGFATIPAYLADLFGTQMVGAIHGRLLTAWSVAGVLGPVLVNYLNDWQIKSGVEKAAAYDTTMYVLSGLLVVGFICNLLVRPVADKWFMTDEELAAERKLAHDKAHADVLAEHAAKPSDAQAKASSPLLVFGFWILVLVPIAWGVWMTILQALALF
ncbi:MAG: OFA family MFS transporter [Acidobacteria bacterium]|nr:OFA family MFS transporter [Acidobacteriota bacterium]MBK8810500.1 OFA family MFS transporter [Acidobacteriota bacterium]